MGRVFLFHNEYCRTYELIQTVLRELKEMDLPGKPIIAQAHTLWGAALLMEGRATTQNLSSLSEKQITHTGTRIGWLEVVIGR